MNWLNILTKLNYKYMVLIVMLAFLAAIFNNVTQKEERKVKWFSGQEILPY
jgi:hypothetical protein